MIYACIRFDRKLSLSQQALLNMSKTLTWDGCIYKPLTWKGFSGAVLLSRDLPYQESDHVWLDEQNGILVMMDGTVFNREELCRELSVSGQELKDPKLVCLAFLRWGPSFAERLNGDFAVCIYREKENQVFLFRDHLGIRPLAFSNKGQALYLSTDMMGLCKALFPGEKIDADYMLNQFVWVGYDYDILPRREVKKLKPGHYLRADSEGQDIIRYWQPEKIKEDNRLDAARVKAELEELLYDAVAIRADKRFTASAHVSGALDSSVVAALARKEYAKQKDFYGFSWTPLRAAKEDRMPYDERELVKKTCAQNDIQAVFADYGPEDCMGFNADWRSTVHYLAERKTIELARAKKVNLIFSGWGGDEFISINNRGIDADLVRGFDWKYFFKKYPLSRPKKIISVLLFNVFFTRWQRSYGKYRADIAIYPYIKKALGSNLVPPHKRYRYRSRRDVHLQLLTMGHLDQRTSDWYVKGQHHGIEYRYPLLDKRIVEYMLKVPSRCLVGGNHHRIMLREIAKNILPAEVAYNKSKADPVGNLYFVHIARETLPFLMSNVDVYAANPDLDFVDFELIRKNMPRMVAPGRGYVSRDDATIFPYLKAADDFTKGYYEKP